MVEEEYRVIRTTMPQYGECEYWDERYTQEPAAFDWYQGYSGLSAILQHVFPMHGTLLQVGVGSSRLQEEMARAGWRHIVNIDYSRVVIAHMTDLHRGFRALEYRVADARNMSEFQDGSFDGVVDKGTLDAILCGDHSGQNAAAMITECFRVLRPGAAMMLVTYGDPVSRLPYLDAVPGWDIVVYALTKQEVLEAMDAEPIVRPLIKGPYPANNADCMDALSGLEGMHFVYVCRKHRDGAQRGEGEQREQHPQEPEPEYVAPALADGSREQREAEGADARWEETRPQLPAQAQVQAQGVLLSHSKEAEVPATHPPAHPDIHPQQQQQQQQQQPALSGLMATSASSAAADGDEEVAGASSSDEAPGALVVTAPATPAASPVS